MSTRLCLCLLIVCASAGVAARDVKSSSANSGSGPEPSAESVVPAKEKPRVAAPVREAKPRPALHGDLPARPSLRWHSFLPGMFR